MRTLATYMLLTLAACGTTDRDADPSKPSVAGPQTRPADVVAPVSKELQAKAISIFKPLPTAPVAGANTLTDARVGLGRLLFSDARLSKNQQISCNTCHPLDQYGVDGKRTSTGHKGQAGTRNSPTVYNASLQASQFWDGRAADVEEQASGPILNPVEMAMADGSSVTALLKSIPDYAPLFVSAFPDSPDPVDMNNATIAIGAFERTLLTPGPLDLYLAGQAGALTPEQQDGLAVFMDTGCTTCHNGSLLGGQTLVKLGVVKPYDTADMGRYEVTQRDADKHVFKVPSLRNVAKTGPYFHDGSIPTLKEAVSAMAEYQLGKTLNQKQVAQIVAFLGALTGPLPTEFTTSPELPNSGPHTPAPDPT